MIDLSGLGNIGTAVVGVCAGTAGSVAIWALSPMIRKFIAKYIKGKAEGFLAGILAAELKSENPLITKQFNTVKLEIMKLAEMLVPNGGLGAEKKEFVLFRFPPAIRPLISGMIDDDVKILDETLKSGIDKLQNI